MRAISQVQTPPPPTVAGTKTGSLSPGSGGSTGGAASGGAVDACAVSSGVEEVSNRKLFVGGANLRGCGRFDLCPDMRSIRHSGLASFDLSGLESLEGNWRGLGSLESLTSVNLRGCTRLLGDLRVLTQLTLLERIDVADCFGLTGFLGNLFEALPRLAHLDLTNCHRIKGNLSQLPKLPNLTFLSLKGCSGVSGELSRPVIACIGALRAKRGEGAVALSATGSLVIAKDQRKDFSVTVCHLAGVSSLSGDLKAFSPMLSLTVLVLSGATANITGDIKALAELTRLTRLDLSGRGSMSRMTGDPTSLAGLHKLTDLNLLFCHNVTKDHKKLQALCAALPMCMVHY